MPPKDKKHVEVVCPECGKEFCLYVTDSLKKKQKYDPKNCPVCDSKIIGLTRSATSESRVLKLKKK